MYRVLHSPPPPLEKCMPLGEVKGGGGIGPDLGQKSLEKCVCETLKG